MLSVNSASNPPYWYRSVLAAFAIDVTQIIADKERSNICVVFTLSACFKIKRNVNSSTVSGLIGFKLNAETQ